MSEHQIQQFKRLIEDIGSAYDYDIKLAIDNSEVCWYVANSVYHYLEHIQHCLKTNREIPIRYTERQSAEFDAFGDEGLSEEEIEELRRTSVGIAVDLFQDDKKTKKTKDEVDAVLDEFVRKETKYRSKVDFSEVAESGD